MPELNYRNCRYFEGVLPKVTEAAKTNQGSVWDSKLLWTTVGFFIGVALVEQVKK